MPPAAFSSPYNFPQGVNGRVDGKKRRPEPTQGSLVEKADQTSEESRLFPQVRKKQLQNATAANFTMEKRFFANKINNAYSAEYEFWVVW